MIYGAGGLGREVKSMLNSTTEQFELTGFLDDGVATGSLIENVKVLGGLSWLNSCPHDVFVVIAIGNPKIKSELVRRIHPEWKIKFATIIHNRAIIQNTETVDIGIGSIVCAGSVLTTGIKIGMHVLINLNTTIGHDTIVGDCTSIMPGVNLAGHVFVGNNVLIGSGANIINDIRIGSRAMIGAGSVVNHAIPESVTAVGVPARVINKINRV